jgi:hypothetical protein
MWIPALSIISSSYRVFTACSDTGSLEAASTHPM